MHHTPRQVLRFLTTKRERFWERAQRTRALELFHRAAVAVPAYKDFLRKNGINPDRITTWRDFQSVPPTDKKNYLHAYHLRQLLWNGSLEHPMTFSATSGSTGKPFYFPRTRQLEEESSVIHEAFLRNGSHGADIPTLVIVGFGMGVWIGGPITYRAFAIARERGYPVSIITPGVNKAEIINALKYLAPKFAQTILVGYPPFVKDIIDEAPLAGIRLKKLNIRLLFAAEAFTERFRDYVVRRAGVQNPMTDTLNVYGSADIGTMAYETPTAIFIRRCAAKNRALFRALFPDVDKTPTLAQYNPLYTGFESVGGELLLTGDSALPLVRYAIGDHGGTWCFGEIVSLLGKHGVRFADEARKAGIAQMTYELPFVYVYERSDLSTTLYGLQVYPEFIKNALLDPAISRWLSGKFSLQTKFDEKQNQYLDINIELQKGMKETAALRKRVSEKIFHHLQKNSSEFREIARYIGKRAVPRVHFWPAEHAAYFAPGAKQRWVLK